MFEELFFSEIAPFISKKELSPTNFNLNTDFRPPKVRRVESNDPSESKEQRKEPQRLLIPKVTRVVTFGSLRYIIKQNFLLWKFSEKFLRFSGVL